MSLILNTCVLLLAILTAAADFIEIGEGGALTTNRPFCGS